MVATGRSAQDETMSSVLDSDEEREKGRRRVNWWRFGWKDADVLLMFAQFLVRVLCTHIELVTVSLEGTIVKPAAVLQCGCSCVVITTFYCLTSVLLKFLNQVSII